MKRRGKRKIKKSILAIFFGLLVVMVTALVFSFSKSFVDVFNKFAVESSDPIVKPLGSFTSPENIKTLLDDKNIILESIDATGSAIIVAKIKGGPRVFFSKTRDASWQVNSLQLILSKLTVDNKKPDLIDLRSDRPIVKF
mgnify:FL=1